MTEPSNQDLKEEQSEKPKDFGAWRAFGLTSTLGCEMAACTVAGAFLGNKLDDKFQTTPWLLVAGVLLGMAMGIWSVINTLKRFL